MTKLAQKYGVERVRLINENIFDSFSLSGKYNFILNGGIVKYMLLRSFTAINVRHADLYQDMKFYSILYTGVVTKDILEKIKKSDVCYEIMVHPSIIALDENVFFYDKDEKNYRVSQDREYELDTVLTTVH